MNREDQHLSLFDSQQRRLGEVVLDREDGSWRSGVFEPSPEFSVVEPLFREHLECANQQLFTHVDELDARIAQLGLRLVTDRGELLQGVASIEIGEGRLSFRSENTRLDSGFNGASRAPAKTASTP
jgi:hypothetical protein